MVGVGVGGGGTKQASDFAFQWLSSGSGAHLVYWELCGVCVCVSLASLTHTHTSTFTKLTCCNAAGAPRAVKAAQTAEPDALIPSYTNKQTHLLLLASRSDNQPKEGRQTKQTV